uniref:Uncharacterized protein n=1 Tax=Macaca fascicularis TaxID=9541 RepID=A0A7N9CE25_MACFA
MCWLEDKGKLNQQNYLEKITLTLINRNMSKFHAQGAQVCYTC